MGGSFDHEHYTKWSPKVLTPRSLRDRPNKSQIAIKNNICSPRMISVGPQRTQGSMETLPIKMSQKLVQELVTECRLHMAVFDWTRLRHSYCDTTHTRGPESRVNQNEKPMVDLEIRNAIWSQMIIFIC